MEKLKLIPGLTKRQKKFITLFATLFNVRSASGKLSNFNPEPFQQEFLAGSMLCNKHYENRICNKGRGIGLTALISGEILIAARTMPNVKIPVTSISARTANVLLNWCIDLADTSNEIKIEEGKLTIERDKTINSVCKLKNGSTIIPISGGSPDSIRSLRAPMMILDEYAFAEYQKEILTAGERCLSEGGQITIISTPRTADVINDEYWRIWVHAEEMGYKRYTFPIFEKDKINVHESLLTQNLTPIAPWIDIAGLERDRSRDLLMFSRENLCEPADESVAFLSWDLIKKCCILKDFHKPFPDHPIFAGADIGRMQDLTAIEGFQLVDGKYYHVFEKIMRGIDIPTQIYEIGRLDDKYDLHSLNIDKTGLGLGLYDYARKELGGKVRGVTFTRETKTKMATNLRNKMQDDEVYLINNSHFMDVIHSLPYDTLNGGHTALGHQDQFWACALALMKPRSQIVDASSMLDNYI
jgi:phage FluMu gp28-like protein